MTVLVERNLQITFDDAVEVRKFDNNDTHRLTHCMKAVDYIVELPGRHLFIEIKDPQDPKAPPEAAADYLARLQTGEIDEDLKYKFRDSFLYEWASGRAGKPIDYLVLIGLDTLTGLHLQRRTRALERQLPLLGPDSAAWPNPMVNGCAVFNLESWNRTFSQWPVSRLGS